MGGSDDDLKEVMGSTSITEFLATLTFSTPFVLTVGFTDMSSVAGLII